ncbi:alpha/beta hydrolase [Wielerella bovis]|uniref:alpha/beta hydrolase n=1 Tax=Wielerella bovis TaxID=2917790 RepID=UPI0020195937|nr:alpha/beta fold hydrolase [Wielerella bovis]ULJ59531.1 alpha/beta hydrolase [Wielerella bovis]ULJ63888.1 alpha/beta hydrolase [Wielerella bovis]ULJ68130.1 alpha/beta hydrolase [Wielerella bovis]
MATHNFMPSEKPIILGHQHAPKVLILIHGLTLSGRQFVPIGEFLLAHLGQEWQVILPTAPVQRVTWLGGQMTTAWFDLPVGRFDKNQDETGLNQANHYLHRLINELVQTGVNPSNIVLGGFSQGGALALLSALTYPARLGGAVCLSGYLPMADKLGNALQRLDKLPILMAHGTNDEPIDISLANNAVLILQNDGFDVAFKSYPIGHTIDERELLDVANWLKNG